MICPYCRHSDGLHSEPSTTGLADDGGRLSPDYRPGHCGQSKLVEGVWIECPCPGWHPDLPEPVLGFDTGFARGYVNAAPQLDAPFSLRGDTTESFRTPKQKGLFE